MQLKKSTFSLVLLLSYSLGFAHNFAASTNNRASVMDYPHPYIKLNNGEIDLSQAYDTGIGDWDKVTVAYSYQDFPKNVNEENELNKIIQNSIDKGMKFIADSDARPQGGAHIYAHLWDNGKNPAQELERILKVRATAISNFSEKNIGKNEPYTVLEDVFVPLYFFHRYQVEATSKMIGGLDYSYAVKGDNQIIVQEIDATIEKAMGINDQPVVIDFRVHRDAMVWPMVAAGTSNDDIMVARETAPDWDSQEL